jgi:EpsD family peptidyl-prolyl cis-trans isomerase
MLLPSITLFLHKDNLQNLVHTNIHRVLPLTSALALCIAVSACGEKSGPAKASQVIAKVNDAELSIHQLNFALQGVTESAPEQSAKIRKIGLERLAEQEALVQDAINKKVDRDPAVQQQLEAARRDILVRNHLQKIGASILTPNDEAITKFYKENPGLFSDRNIYQFTELNFPRVPENWAEVEKGLAPTKTIQEVLEVLRLKGFNLPVSQNIVRAAEDLPVESVKQIAAQKDGEIIIYGRPPGIVIAQIMARKAAPLDEAKAKPAIEKFLMNKARGELVQAEIKRVKDAAKITYLGDFAKDAVPKAPAVKPVETTTKDPSKEVLDKGLKGLK